jgi:large subunit ribosomal protein L31
MHPAVFRPATGLEQTLAGGVHCPILRACTKPSLPSSTLKKRSRNAMKEGIHPNYQPTTVTCGCGNSFTTRSVRPELKIDICNECHPFYTGKLKYVDTAGRIDKFQKKFAAGTYGSLAPKKKATKKATKK